MKQAARMVATRSKDVKKKGGGIGAVMTVIPDHRAISHSVGIVGTVYKMKVVEPCWSICDIPGKMVAPRLLSDQVKYNVLFRTTILHSCT
jgi:hypothetical protein